MVIENLSMQHTHVMVAPTCLVLLQKKSSRPEGGDNASLTALLTQVHDIRGVMASNVAKWKSTGRDTRLSGHEDHCVSTATDGIANVSCFAQP